MSTRTIHFDTLADLYSGVPMWAPGMSAGQKSYVRQQLTGIEFAFVTLRTRDGSESRVQVTPKLIRTWLQGRVQHVSADNLEIYL